MVFTLVGPRRKTMRSKIRVTLWRAVRCGAAAVAQPEAGTV